MIERIAPPTNVLKNLRKQKDELIYVLAEEGIWYDALQIIWDLIEQNPDSILYRELRTELLDQGNLTAVAEFERDR